MIIEHPYDAKLETRLSIPLAVLWMSHPSIGSCDPEIACHMFRLSDGSVMNGILADNTSDDLFGKPRKGVSLNGPTINLCKPPPLIGIFHAVVAKYHFLLVISLKMKIHS